MNGLVVIQATQALLAHLGEDKRKGIVIGHDHRHNSLDFARLAAAACLAQNVPVYFYPNLVHTPLVPFGVLKLKASAGIMITASHNPKQDNGFKVYLGNGCQIIPPVDSLIADLIPHHAIPLSWAMDPAHPLLVDPTHDMTNLYFTTLSTLVSRRNPDHYLQICYTPMHGVGLEFATRAVSLAGLPEMLPVPSQMLPDPEFPTVKFPNPEEKGALDEAIKFASSHDCPVIFANDPDADRFACAELDKNSRKWIIFNGNQIGILLASFHLERMRKKDGSLDSNLAVLTTTVSSHMLQELAKVEGLYFEETLTGFKWLGNRAIELEKEGYRVIFAYEEAIGYMCGDVVFDKDGVSALLVFYDFANALYGQGKTIQSHLDTLYKKYGYWVSNNSYYICHDPMKTSRIFDGIRFGLIPIKAMNEVGFELNYPKTIAGFNVVSVRDLTVGYDSTKTDNKPTLMVSKTSQMVTFCLENDCLITLRTSGTEPKIKYYTELKGVHHTDIKSAQETLDTIVESAIEELLQPKANGLLQ